MRTVRATQYITALREGGSLPAIVAAEDSGMYVLKFRGAGQGPLALVAELVAGEIGRRLGLSVPELVFVEIDAAFGRNEPDQEIRDLIRRSVGLNLALDYLPGSTMFDPAAGDQADPATASLAVWFDAFVSNVDRTPRNANLLSWHRQLYFIDHGAALYWHHDWPNAPRKIESPFPEVNHHILLPWALDLEAADKTAHQRLNANVLTEVLALVPDAWLLRESEAEADSETPAARREAYVQLLTRRLNASSSFVQEALRARAELV
ncbi:HipA family kinase [Granulicella sp. dw_53]|uniref:HipA family kinase n=1 Tax=Granulicella sp. dw_53 TaxID=2719792 RepID=UPI001BD314DF